MAPPYESTEHLIVISCHTHSNWSYCNKSYVADYCCLNLLTLIWRCFVSFTRIALEMFSIVVFVY